MTQLPLFYSSIAVLDRNTNRDIRLSAPERPYAFASGAHLAPALAAEFALGCRDMPILFLDESAGVSPLFLVGVRSNENAFVGSAGQWLGQHIPAYLRRYPFIGGEMSAERQVICFDGGCPHIQLESGERLFTDEGAPTAALERAVTFVSEYADAAKATAAFTTHLKSLDLLRTVNIDIRSPRGASATFHGFSAVDEAKLAALPDDAFVELRKKGYLAPIYAHLFSLANFGWLGDRASVDLTVASS